VEGNGDGYDQRPREEPITLPLLFLSPLKIRNQKETSRTPIDSNKPNAKKKTTKKQKKNTYM